MHALPTHWRSTGLARTWKRSSDASAQTKPWCTSRACSFSPFLRLKCSGSKGFPSPRTSRSSPCATGPAGASSTCPPSDSIKTPTSRSPPPARFQRPHGRAANHSPRSSRCLPAASPSNRRAPSTATCRKDWSCRCSRRSNSGAWQLTKLRSSSPAKNAT